MRALCQRIGLVKSEDLVALAAQDGVLFDFVALVVVSQNAA